MVRRRFSESFEDWDARLRAASEVMRDAIFLNEPTSCAPLEGLDEQEPADALGLLSQVGAHLRLSPLPSDQRFADRIQDLIFTKVREHEVKREVNKD